jgi:hypothetical protein
LLLVVALQAVLLVVDKVFKVLQLLVGLVVAVQVAVPHLQLQVVKVVMADSHLAEAVVVAQELQLVAQVVEAQQVKLEFGVGNDIKQYNTNT